MGETLCIFILFWAVILGMVSTNEYETGEKALAIIEECEKALPRDQTCILTAKPLINERG